MNQKNFTKVKYTVGYKLLKMVFSLYVVIAIFMTLIHMYSEFNHEKSIIMQDMKHAEKLFEQQLITGIWNFDVALLENVITSILSSRSIIGMSIYMKESKELSNFGIVDNKFNSITSKVLKNPNKAQYQKDLYVYTFNLNYKSSLDEVELGSVSFFSNKEIIFQRVKNNFALLIINSIVKTFALWIIFLFYSKKYLTKPFFEMIETTKDIDFKNIKRKNLKKYLTKANENEFDILKKTFFNMITRLKTAYLKLDLANKKNITLNENLERLVRERTIELEESILRLESTQEQLIKSEKMASLGGLVAGVAHEINTPVGISLTGITHFLEITKHLETDYYAEQMSEEKFVEYIKTSKKLATQINTNLERTVNLVKSFKLVAIDQTNDEKRVFLLKEYIQTIIFSLNNVIKKTNLKITVNCDDQLSMDSHPGLCSQIITNLIMNSINHGFELKEEGLISIDLNKENGNLIMIYKDNGKGIEKDILPKIFDPFFTTNREFGGTGLGLNVIYNIITATLNGSIECKSEVGKGVTFKIIIPTSA